MMAKDKSTLRFWLRTDRTNKNGSSPVHLVYQIKKDRKYYGVPGISLLFANWDIKEQCAVNVDKRHIKQMIDRVERDLRKCDDDKQREKLQHKIDSLCNSLDNADRLLTGNDVKEVNAQLDKVRKDISNIEKRFELDGMTYNVDKVIEKLLEQTAPKTAKKEQPSINVVDFINAFVKDSTGTHKEGTLKVYTTLANHLSDFEKAKSVRVTFSNIDISMLRSFQSFLATERKRKDEETGKMRVIHAMNNISIAKQISTLKTILNYARSIYKYQVNQDYRDFKVSRKDGNFEVIALTGDELQQIVDVDVSGSKKLEKVKDIFLFSCFTSLRYSDLVDLKWEHINWRKKTIEKNAVKTGQRLLIPLTPQSYAILQKYKQKEAIVPLPMISGQKLNDYIKELAEEAKINTPIEIVREYGKVKKSEMFKKWQVLSIHSGRKTFITDALSRGIAPQDVMSISGHSQWKSFRRYYEVTDQRKMAFMEKAYGAVKEDNKLKAV